MRAPIPNLGLELYISGQTKSKFGVFGRVRVWSNLVLADELRFKWVQILSCQIWICLKFVTFWIKSTPHLVFVFDDFNQRSIMRSDDLSQHQMYKCMWNIENLPFSMANLCIFFFVKIKSFYKNLFKNNNW